MICSPVQTLSWRKEKNGVKEKFEGEHSSPTRTTVCQGDSSIAEIKLSTTLSVPGKDVKLIKRNWRKTARGKWKIQLSLPPPLLWTGEPAKPVHCIAVPEIARKTVKSKKFVPFLQSFNGAWRTKKQETHSERKPSKSLNHHSAARKQEPGVRVNYKICRTSNMSTSFEDGLGWDRMCFKSEGKIGVEIALDSVRYQRVCMWKRGRREKWGRAPLFLLHFLVKICLTLRWKYFEACLCTRTAVIMGFDSVARWIRVFKQINLIMKWRDKRQQKTGQGKIFLRPEITGRARDLLGKHPWQRWRFFKREKLPHFEWVLSSAVSTQL